MVLNIRTSSLLATLLFAAVIFLASNAEADGPGEAFLPLGFYGGLSPNEESGWVNFTYTEDSSGDYYCTVTNTTAEYDIEDYAYYLLDSTGTTSEFGEIAMQNLSGNVVGVDVSYDATCGDSCDADLQTRSDAVDADDGALYAVTFNDNDRDGKLSAGDKFTARGNGHSSNGPAEDEWSLEVKFDNTGDVIGSKRLG
ncbi:MAG: hypothetical protein QGG57_03000 [Candidatus Poseidoniia archaeon]|jgi:hypothetical protein|nr:hypothetical protein [Candidatus Poseidoniia archaeon]MDP7007140.1 hypothetical protein [Candidatus Poseidoniia archaeon]